MSFQVERNPYVKRSLFRRGLAVLVSCATLGSMAAFIAAAPPAAAAGPILMAGGSDTTQNVMGAILSQAAGQYNVRAAVGVGQPDAVLTVPQDTNCPHDITYSTDQTVVNTLTNAHSPNGSGAGLDALKAAETSAYPVSGAGGAGCIDIARSSGGPRGLASDPATFEYYAFGLDAVSWASPSLQAPATMTLATLLSIYNCTFTDWSQVPGGGVGPIQRYLPQASSGTRKFFISDLLGGFDPTTVSNASCPAVIATQLDNGGAPLEENTGTEIDNAGYQKAILPYSAGQWVFQANNKVNPTVDLRNGVKIGGIITTALTANPAGWDAPDGVWQPNSIGANAPIQEKNVKLNSPPAGFFPGIRYVFNVIDSVSPNYLDARAVVAFNNVASGAKSPMCSGSKASTISSFGFATLSATTPAGVAASTNLAGATCREFTN
jgi:ABC-type phosphate transport system substrate-binding protein